MKTMKRILSAVLAIAMMLSVLSVSAFALNKAPQYKSYVFFGDSITAAVGIPGYNELVASEGTAEGKRVRGSYADLLATKVGVEEDKYFNEAHSAWRSAELRMVLDETYDGDAVAQAWAAGLFGEGKSYPSREAYMDIIRAEVEQADLITVAIGSNDMLVNLILNLTSLLNPTADENYKLWLIEKLLAQYGSENEVINQLAAQIAAIHGITFTINKLIQFLNENLKIFQQNYAVILRKLHEINPDARLISVGYYNPMRDAKISDSIPINVGHIMDAPLIAMNAYVRTLCATRSYYNFVSVWNAEVISTSNLSDFDMSGTDFWGKFIIEVHPSEAGHKYIANNIYSTLQLVTPSSRGIFAFG